MSASIVLTIWGTGEAAPSFAIQMRESGKPATYTVVPRRWWQFSPRHVLTWTYTLERYSAIEAIVMGQYLRPLRCTLTITN